MASFRKASAGADSEFGRSVRKRLLQVGSMFLVLVASLFLSAGRLDWWTGWIYLGLLLAGVLFAAGWALSAWSMASNKFFSTTVRIQEERGHAVVSGGPYAFVRHPGYLAFSLAALATPFLLSSLWALLPALLAVAAVAVRTVLEDRTLRAELPGYQEYTQRVRYRCLPGIW